MSDRTDDNRFDIGDLKVDRKHARVVYRGENIFLSPPLFRMLACLHEAAPDLLDRAKIFRAVWGTKDLGETNVDKTVDRLNKKLIPFGFEVRNEPRLGYRLAGVQPNTSPFESIMASTSSLNEED